jgi:malonate-semialdehyde dehydrogenase (acetylating)/methylmalonate-semialdehyde dehydrogenase
VPIRIAKLFIKAGRRELLNVVNGDRGGRRAVTDASRRSASSARPISRSIIRPGPRSQRVQCFGSAKNHMIVMPDADVKAVMR